MITDLANRFNYHPPQDEETKDRHERVRMHCLAAATAVLGETPAGREQSRAITKLEEAMMWANAAIARAVPEVPPAAAPGGIANPAPDPAAKPADSAPADVAPPAAMTPSDATGVTAGELGVGAQAPIAEPAPAAAPADIPAASPQPAVEVPAAPPAPEVPRTLYTYAGPGPVDGTEWLPAPVAAPDGRALFLFAGDANPGDANGQSAEWVVYPGPATSPAPIS